MKTQFKLLILFLVFLSFFSKAQDLIITKDGTRLYCQIVSENPTSLFYVITTQTIQAEILKSEVMKYEFDWKKNQKTNAIPQNTFIPTKVGYVQIAFDFGISIPTGEFANKDINSSTSGLANVGFLGGLHLKIKGAQKIGLSGGYIYQSNSFETYDLNNYFLKQNPGVSFTTTASSWKLNGPYIGLHCAVPIFNDKDMNLIFQSNVVWARYTSPRIETVGRSAFGGGFITQEASEASGAAFFNGIGFFKRINKDIGVNMMFNYLTGKAKFKNIRTTGSGGFSSLDDYNQLYSTIALEIGLCIFLD